MGFAFVLSLGDCSGPLRGPAPMRAPVLETEGNAPSCPVLPQAGPWGSSEALQPIPSRPGALEWAFISASESMVPSLPVPKESATPSGKGHWKGHFPFPVYRTFRPQRPVLSLREPRTWGQKPCISVGRRKYDSVPLCYMSWPRKRHGRSF